MQCIERNGVSETHQPWIVMTFYPTHVLCLLILYFIFSCRESNTRFMIRLQRKHKGLQQCFCGMQTPQFEHIFCLLITGNSWDIDLWACHVNRLLFLLLWLHLHLDILPYWSLQETLVYHLNYETECNYVIQIIGWNCLSI